MDNPDSNALIAFRYMYGDGTPKNAIKSADYLYRAIKFGSEWAKKNLSDYGANKLVISHLQERMQADGSYEGSIDGTLGKQTRAAIESIFGSEKPS